MFEPTTYEIVIRGRADARVLHPLLDDFVCDHADDGVTRLIGEVHDPAHLHGVVAHLTSVNAELISIAPVDPTCSTAANRSHTQHRTGMDDNIMITVTGLTKHYGDRVAVDDMTFDVAAGRVTGFVGPNGAGKSTTMRMMVGLTRPDRGDVRYHGIAYTRLLQPARVVGSVLDARCMHPGRTARNHLRATAALSAIPARRVDEVLAEVGLESAADQRAGSFSLGMRQRLALAGALLGEPEVLLLDEPSNGLDPDGIRWLRNTLIAFAENGGTVFVSSHLIGELEMFADDLVVVGGGRLLAAEPVATTLARGQSTVVVRTPQSAELAGLLHRGNVEVAVPTTASRSAAPPPPRCRRSRSTIASSWSRSARPHARSRRSCST